MIRHTLAFLVFLSPLILVHELAHALSGYFLGADVQEFSIGFGPSLTNFSIDQVEVHIRLILLGGYVYFGDASLLQITSVIWKDAIIFGSGPLSNLLLGIICISRKKRLAFDQAMTDNKSGGYIWVAKLCYNAIKTKAIRKAICILSISVGIFNLLPIPPLDGSKLALLLLKPSLSEDLLHRGFVAITLFLLAFLIISQIIHPIYKHLRNN